MQVYSAAAIKIAQELCCGHFVSRGMHSVNTIRQASWRPVALGGILWLLVATSSLLLQALSGQL